LAGRMISNADAMSVPENIRKVAVFTMISSVLTLLGGILMFRLSKAGFWMYLLGTVVGIAGPLVTYGTGNLISIFTGSIMVFIGIIFVILYSLHLKHLR